MSLYLLQCFIKIVPIHSSFLVITRIHTWDLRMCHKIINQAIRHQAIRHHQLWVLQVYSYWLWIYYKIRLIFHFIHRAVAKISWLDAHHRYTDIWTNEINFSFPNNKIQHIFFFLGSIRTMPTPTTTGVRLWSAPRISYVKWWQSQYASSAIWFCRCHKFLTTKVS